MSQVRAATGERGAGAPPRGEVLAVVLLLIAATVLRGVMLEARSLWFDEAFSVHMARLSLSGMIAVGRDFDPHPPLYYLLLRAWMVFGDGPAAVRSLSTAFGVATVWATWALGRRVAGPPLGLASAALVASSAFAIQASVDARMYPLLGLLAVLSTSALLNALEALDRRRPWVAYAAILILIVYTHVFAVLLLAAHALFVLLWYRRSRSARQGFLLASLAAVAAFMPWLGLLAEHMGRGMLNPVWLGAMPPGGPVNIISLSAFGGHVFESTHYLLRLGPLRWQQVAAVLPFAGLVAAGAVAGPDRAGRRLVLLAWLTPVLLLLGLSLARGVNYALPRYTAFLQPFFAILLAGGLLALGSRFRSRAAMSVALVGVVAAANLGVLALTVADPRYQVYDWRAAARHVEAGWQDGDAILYFPVPARIAFRYYFTRTGVPETVLALPSFGLALSRQEWAPLVPRLPPDLREARRVWFIVTLPWPRNSLEAVLDMLDRELHRQDVSDYRNVWVFSYVRRNP